MSEPITLAAMAETETKMRIVPNVTVVAYDIASAIRARGTTT